MPVRVAGLAHRLVCYVVRCGYPRPLRPNDGVCDERASLACAHRCAAVVAVACRQSTFTHCQCTVHSPQFSVWKPTILPLMYLTEFTTVAGYIAAVRNAAALRQTQ